LWKRNNCAGIITAITIIAVSAVVTAFAAGGYSIPTNGSWRNLTAIIAAITVVAVRTIITNL
jgi:hypothetical protein